MVWKQRSRVAAKADQVASIEILLLRFGDNGALTDYGNASVRSNHENIAVPQSVGAFLVLFEVSTFEIGRIDHATNDVRYSENPCAFVVVVTLLRSAVLGLVDHKPQTQIGPAIGERWKNFRFGQR